MPNGQCYKGEWYDDLMHGRGIYTNQDGARFEGEFREDRKNG